MDTSPINIFEKNIQQLFHVHPTLAAQLFGMSQNERYEVFMGKDPLDINMLDMKTNEFLYAAPIADTENFMHEHESKERMRFRYFFGIGNGVAIKAFLKAAHVQRILIFEPDPEMLYIVLNLIDFSEELESKKLVLELSDNMDYPNAYHYLMHMEGKIYARLFEVEVLTDYYYRVFGDELTKLNTLLTKTIETNIISHGNDMIDSLWGIENHIINLPDMIKSIPIKSLADYKSAKTAIVVSTGPSLSKQIPLLKQIKDYVTIISVDASYPILERNGIKPDFVCALERVPETAKFFETSSPEFQKDVNFVFVSYVHMKTKDAITTGNKIMVMRPNEYLKYFDLEQYGYIGVNMSAANLAHELGIAMGIKNIILIGQDLAFGDDNSSHAEGHVYGENEESVDGHEIYVKRYGGEGEIRTTKYWVLFKNGFEKTISKYKEMTTTINCTEGGARIEGAVELPFKEAIDQYVDYSFVKEKVELKYATPDKQKEYTDKYIDKINFWIEHSIKYQEIVEEIFMEVQEECENYLKLSEENRLDELDMEVMLHTLDQIDKVKSMFDDDTFADLYTSVLQSYILNLEIILAPISLERAETELEKKAKMLKWIMNHRYWLFIIAGGIDATRVTILRAIESWPEELRERIVKRSKKEIEVDVEKYEALKKKLSENQLFEIVEK